MEKQPLRKTKDFTPGNCPVVYCLNLIGGKWKPNILHLIRTGGNRYSILLKTMTEISKQTLTNQLRELEADGLIDRTIFPEIPPRVEYTLTPFGRSLLLVIDSMYAWGIANMEGGNKGYCDDN